MHHLLLLFGILHLPKAYTLKCYECAAGSSATCIDKTKECPPLATQCSALRLIVYSGESVIADVNGKSCSFADHCAQASVNFGVTRTILTNQCCTTDLCNSFAVPDLSKTRPNGKKCFTCNGRQCAATVECLGNEYHCISTTVDVKGQKTAMKGCASKQLCTNTEQMEGLIGNQISCCEGDYCNSGSRPRAGLLLLGAPLLPLVIMSP
ncbi:urokinase plasminogen activator surface receptor-like [Phyllopteryx taeniolatus]|uniref:urokinase plasminogen activator surface receptor-like n=1 Tax=Phyllopteryx taeniolatus TaxID=161469 RepID=UPI002AD3DBDC|nr:urokinase plasminogen activator surface receptor-like [Phyllopteryx taeniolatus]